MLNHGSDTLLLKCIVLTTEYDISELRDLLDTLGMEIVHTFFQDRTPHPRTFLGKGKMEEVLEWVEEADTIESVVVNHELRPAQLYFLEKTFGLRVFDRIGIILEIFSRNAHSREARLQVELADLNYQIPFIREYIHNAKKGEHPGFMAGGEYAVDEYYMFIRRRMAHIRKELEDIRKDREAKRRARRRKGFYLVAIAGYTNAGKSTLLNALTGEQILVENRMFSTLSTTTRRIDSRQRILVTDTVGFIKDLPPWLIEAFKATLEEVFQADAIVLVLDVSENIEDIGRKLRASEDILFPDIGGIPVILALNKCDMLSEEDIRDRILLFSKGPYRPVPISAKTGQGLDELVSGLDSIFAPEISIRVWLPAGEEGILSWAYDNGMVRDISRKNGIEFSVDMHERYASALEKKVIESGGRIISVERSEQNI